MMARIKCATNKTPPCEGAVQVGDDWIIEIPDLAALLKLCRDVKDDLIIGLRAESKFTTPSDFEITIYDDYVE